jgi:putative transposase
MNEARAFVAGDAQKPEPAIECKTSGRIATEASFTHIAVAPQNAPAGDRAMNREPAELIDQLVAARIRARRSEMGITLQGLAQQIGVAFQQAHKYEHGLSRISAGRLYHVACALDAPVNFFFATSEPTAPDAAVEVDVLNQHPAGVSALNVCRKHAVSDAISYMPSCMPRTNYGGFDESDASKLKMVKEENRKLKKLLVEAMMEIATLREIIGKNS